MSPTTIITPPDYNSGEAFDHVKGPTHKNNQAVYHTHSQGPAPPVIDLVALTNSLAATVCSLKDEIVTHPMKPDQYPHQSKLALDAQTRLYYVYALQRDGSKSILSHFPTSTYSSLWTQSRFPCRPWPPMPSTTCYKEPHTRRHATVGRRCTGRTDDHHAL